MKLSKEIKNKVDNYFDNITAIDLLNLAIDKYGFTETIIDIEDENFSKAKSIYYESNKKNSSILEVNSRIDIALAA